MFAEGLRGANCRLHGYGQGNADLHSIAISRDMDEQYCSAPGGSCPVRYSLSESLVRERVQLNNGTPTSTPSRNISKCTISNRPNFLCGCFLFVYIQHHLKCIPLTIQTTRYKSRVITSIKSRYPQNFIVVISRPSPVRHFLIIALRILLPGPFIFPEERPEARYVGNRLSEIVTVTRAE